MSNKYHTEVHVSSDQRGSEVEPWPESVFLSPCHFTFDQNQLIKKGAKDGTHPKNFQDQDETGGNQIDS